MGASNPKPQAPTWAELSQSEKIARAAAQFGIDAEPKQVANEKVHAAMIAFCKEHRRVVSIPEIRARVPELPAGTVSSALTSLVEAGRAVRVSKGAYLPVLD